LLKQVIRRPASRDCCTAGSKSVIKIPMIAITTNSSIKLKPNVRLIKKPSAPGK
jgi:hypothetical protein